MSLSDLLERGYFPKELPRPFVTETFSKAVAGAATLPADFNKRAKKGVKFPTGKPARYSLARGGLFRRRLSICNPLHYFQLGREITDHWATFQKHVSGTPIAATEPEFKAQGRAIDGKWPQSARPMLAQKSRLGSRYVLRTDISRFYHSIYTHSIPWAIHTKPVAKANHKFSLLGNKLDFWIRNGQDAQTIGIPIGPDTSLALSELIMHRCDEALIAKMPQVRGFRFIDDYELSFETRTEAEDAFHILESCLAEYELALNPKKTEVAELPLPFEAPWVTYLKRLQFRKSKSGQAADLESYFNSAFFLHQEFPDEAVLQFAIAKLRFMDVHDDNWELFQRLLLNCVMPEPATYPYVLEQIISRVNKGLAPLRDELEETANALISTHATLRHSSEVANALWAALILRLNLHSVAVNSLASTDDSVVALLALDCENNGLTAAPIDKTYWTSLMTAESLYDEHWLLAYEANIKGWLPSAVAGKDHVNDDDNFSYLKAAGVFFYDQALATPPPDAEVPLPSLPTIAIVGGRASP